MRKPSVWANIPRKTCGKKHDILFYFEPKKVATKETRTTLIAFTSKNMTATNTNGNSFQSYQQRKMKRIYYWRLWINIGKKWLDDFNEICSGNCSQDLMTENAFQKLNRYADRIVAGVEGVAACAQTAKKIAPTPVQRHLNDK